MSTAWTASTALSLGDIVAPKNTSPNAGLHFKVIQAGTTGSSEPNWPKEIDQNVYDNNVIYVSFSATFSDLQPINPSAIIELFELKPNNALHGLSTIYRFHSGSNMNANGKIVWAGNDYLRFPIQASGFAFQNGQIPRPKLVVSNATGLISAILLTVNETSVGNDLTGATVTRIRTLAKFIDDANFADVTTTTTSTQTVADPSDAETVTYTVTVVNVEGVNVFALNGTNNPVITMKRGSTYIFDQSHSSNTGHPLRFKQYSGSSYSTGVTVAGTQGSAGSSVTFQPPYPDAPSDLRYYCTVHGNAMGNTITMNNPNTIQQSTTSSTTTTGNPYGTPDPNAEFPREIYSIDRKSNENREIVEFELSSVLDLAGITCPKRQCTRADFPSIGTFVE